MLIREGSTCIALLLVGVSSHCIHDGDCGEDEICSKGGVSGNECVASDGVNTDNIVQFLIAVGCLGVVGGIGALCFKDKIKEWIQGLPAEGATRAAPATQIAVGTAKPVAVATATPVAVATANPTVDSSQ
eukprot:COSAG01_NODE_3926_length_5528_cov_26.315344_1_plen_130_part_00